MEELGTTMEAPRKYQKHQESKNNKIIFKPKIDTLHTK